ncbi:MAG TPA: response regulator [Mycobacteriales bacterium]|nr:response regulator [Mycobacteriales bacterium]
MTRILVVEDEPRIAHFLGKALRLDGHEVVVAEDGEVGLFFALTEPFDLAVLDLTLPGRSGFEVLRELRRERAALPVLMLTGRDDPTSRRACQEAGAAGFLAKPLVVTDLQAEVRALVGGT